MVLPIPFTYLQQFCAEQLTLYTYQNYLEIIVLSCIIYKVLKWLASDYSKPIIGYVYLYAGALFASNLMHAHVLFWILLFCAPTAAILCIIMHQTMIQKYFAGKNLPTFHSATLPHTAWTEMLVRSMLFAAHHKKNIFCIITRENNVLPFLDIPYQLNVPIQPKVLDMLLASSMIENPSIILVDQFGTIKTLNAVWSDTVHDYMIMPHAHTSKEHSNYASSMISSKTDALIWHIDPIHHMATAWFDGAVFQDMSIDQLLMMCKQIMPQQPSSNNPIQTDQHTFHKSTIQDQF